MLWILHCHSKHTHKHGEHLSAWKLHGQRRSDFCLLSCLSPCLTTPVEAVLRGTAEGRHQLPALASSTKPCNKVSLQQTCSFVRLLVLTAYPTATQRLVGLQACQLTRKWARELSAVSVFALAVWCPDWISKCKYFGRSFRCLAQIL